MAEQMAQPNPAQSAPVAKPATPAQTATAQPAGAKPSMMPGAVEGEKKKSGWLKWVLIVVVILVIGFGLWWWLFP